jgi:histidinol-phosphate/aromatic aminotransferase/cobyric acid decarboxylase-like protein
LTQFGLVVIDEAFMDFLPPSRQTSLIRRIADFDNLVVVRSLTKFYSLPGLRLGYGIAQPERLARWQSWRDPWPVNTLAEAAAIAALQDQAYQTASWQWLAGARPRLQAALAGLPGLEPLPGQANYLLVRTEQSAMALQRVLLQRHRILIRDCMSFAELGDRYFRVAVRTASENERLVDALADALTVVD